MYKDFSNYEIFADSRIWSKKRKKFLKPFTRPDGYQIVCLYSNEGKKHWQYVHRICWMAVNGVLEIPSKMQIDHIDENKMNNKISNLRLVSPKDNINHGTRTERAAAALSKAMKGKIPLANPPKRVGAYDKNGEMVMCFPSTAEAGRQGFSQGAVAACCRNCYLREDNNKYKGFVWRYLEDNE